MHVLYSGNFLFLPFPSFSFRSIALFLYSSFIIIILQLVFCFSWHQSCLLMVLSFDLLLVFCFSWHQSHNMTIFYIIYIIYFTFVPITSIILLFKVVATAWFFMLLLTDDGLGLDRNVWDKLFRGYCSFPMDIIYNIMNVKYMRNINNSNEKCTQVHRYIGYT